MIDHASLPPNPGCYLFKDEGERVIYIGKAKSLRKRVASYFQKGGHDLKTQGLVKNISSVDFIVTDSEVEALILENNLIKRHQPRYNIDLKDSKNYAYINLTEEEYPRLLIARKKTGKGSFYGPFVSAQERDHVLYVLNKTFQLRRCKRMPKKACLRLHIGLCSAPCTDGIGKEEYMERVEKARLVLNGRTEELVSSMEKGMNAFSGAMNFERAIELRDQMESLRKLGEHQKADRPRKHDEDILNYLLKGDVVYLALFNIQRGILMNKEEVIFPWTPDFLEEFLVQYYSDNNVPKEVILPEEVDSSVAEFLGKRRNGKVRVTVPKKGGKKSLLELVAKNIEAAFFGDLSKPEVLKDALGLEERPVVIECFDISHLSGTSTVGSMVQFRNGKPDKNNYRRYRIKTVEGIA